MFLQPVIEHTGDQGPLRGHAGFSFDNRGHRDQLRRREPHRLGPVIEIFGRFFLEPLHEARHDTIGREALLKKVCVGEEIAFALVLVYDRHKFGGARNAPRFKERGHLLGHPAFRKCEPHQGRSFLQDPANGESGFPRRKVIDARAYGLGAQELRPHDKCPGMADQPVRMQVAGDFMGGETFGDLEPDGAGRRERLEAPQEKGEAYKSGKDPGEEKFRSAIWKQSETPPCPAAVAGRNFETGQNQESAKPSQSDTLRAAALQ